MYIPKWQLLNRFHKSLQFVTSWWYKSALDQVTCAVHKTVLSFCVIRRCVCCLFWKGWVGDSDEKRGANSQKLLLSCSFSDLTQHLIFYFFKWHHSSFCLLMQQMCQLPPLNNMLTLLKSWLWLCANVQSANKVWTQWDKYLQSNNFQFLTNTNVTLTSDPCEK